MFVQTDRGFVLLTFGDEVVLLSIVHRLSSCRASNVPSEWHRLRSLTFGVGVALFSSVHRLSSLRASKFPPALPSVCLSFLEMRLCCCFRMTWCLSSDFDDQVEFLSIVRRFSCFACRSGFPGSAVLLEIDWPHPKLH